MDWAAVIDTALQVAGGIGDKIYDHNRAQEEHRRQEQFAQHGIQWRVQDAKAAGIHPVYALGGQPSSYAPQRVGSDTFQRMGQNISQNLIELQKIEIEKKKLELLKEKRGLYSDWHDRHGQRDFDQNVQIKPAEPIARYGSAERGTHALWRWHVGTSGRFMRVPSEDVADLASESIRYMAELTINEQVQEIKNVGNALAYSINPKWKRTKKALLADRPRDTAPGHEARYSVIWGNWYEVPIGKEGSQLILERFGWTGKNAPKHDEFGTSGMPGM